MAKALIYNIFSLICLMVVSFWVLFGLFCTAVFAIISALAWFFPSIMNTALIFIAILLIIGVLYTIIMAISILLRQEVVPFIPTRLLGLKYIAPVARSMAKRVPFLNVDKTIRSIINCSNEFIFNELKKTKISKITLLLPHCLQLQSCGMKLTTDIHNCKRCGKCIVDKLIDVSDNFNIGITIASGGTMARRYLIKQRPELVLAVACEQDLLSGIRDTLPLPVLGILNEQPEGPCINTTVDITHIKNYIEMLYKL